VAEPLLAGHHGGGDQYPDRRAVYLQGVAADRRHTHGFCGRPVFPRSVSTGPLVLLFSVHPLPRLRDLPDDRKGRPVLLVLRRIRQPDDYHRRAPGRYCVYFRGVPDDGNNLRRRHMDSHFGTPLAAIESQNPGLSKSKPL